MIAPSSLLNGLNENNVLYYLWLCKLKESEQRFIQLRLMLAVMHNKADDKYNLETLV